MLLKTNESEKFPKLKRLCPPNSVVMYTSFHKIFREILCCKVFFLILPFKHGFEDQINAAKHIVVLFIQ